MSVFLAHHSSFSQSTLELGMKNKKKKRKLKSFSLLDFS